MSLSDSFSVTMLLKNHVNELSIMLHYTPSENRFPGFTSLSCVWSGRVEGLEGVPPPVLNLIPGLAPALKNLTSLNLDI